jgi:protocatechuate 3,4-dioxygenase beta subunit
MIFRYLPLFALAAAALAQAPAEQKPAVIEGMVVNSITQEPLRKVELTLSNGQIAKEVAAMAEQVSPGALPPGTKVSTMTLGAVTDAAGKFRFEQVAPGAYWLTAKKPGFADGKYPEGGGSTGLQVSAGQELKGVEIRMVPNGTVSGRVLDEDGEPVPMCMVTALAYRYQHGRRRLMPADVGQTNPRGEFTLGRLTPGQYMISANVMRMPGLSTSAPPPADGSPETGYVATYYPAAVDASQAQKIDVAAGAELTGFNITLQKAQVVRVKGRLTDANGAPIKAAQLMVVGGAGAFNMSASAVNDPEGKFEITGVQPGTYTIMTMQMQGGAPKISMQPLVVPERGLENVSLGAPPEATITGQLVVAGDAKPNLKDFSVTLTPGETIAVMPAYGRVDETGAFKIEHVAGVPYDVELPLPEGTYIKSVLFNDREKLGQTIDCTGLTSGTLRVVLGTDGGQVTAHVTRDDKPAPKAIVVLLPADPARRFPEAVRTGTSDQSGSVTLKNVPPGSYLAFAWEKVEADAWYDPDFVKKVETGAPSVSVGPKEQKDVQLSLIPAGK